jgi:hypothetical protein
MGRFSHILATNWMSKLNIIDILPFFWLLFWSCEPHFGGLRLSLFFFSFFWGWAGTLVICKNKKPLHFLPPLFSTATNYMIITPLK